ncbi:alpha/beta hydrolase [Solirubrobacter soli]|uniref:alpha/beta hydrolase n=1 Tax=Solirubrobacter soli TaxID=363832 RepID=UPI00069E993D|nr:CocE/NonD family hydrolase [Solirubrobacter soli]
MTTTVVKLLRPGVRAGLALLAAIALTVYGVLHTAYGGVVLGVPTALVGLSLLGLAAWIPWHARGSGSWRSRAVAVPALLLGLFYVVLPLSIGITETQKWRSDVGSPPSAAYRDVSFRAADGVRISGWYRPSRNGATVLVAHGGGSDRRGSVAHASMLARHGYGVLLWDARGRGRSEGRQNAWGWGWSRDVEGALAFLRRQPGVDMSRVGGLGLSTGADVLVQVAGTSGGLRAVVADGTVASSFADVRRVYGVDAITPFFAAEFAAVRLTSGTRPGPTLEDVVPHITAPTLLVAAGPQERDAGRVYDRAAGDAPVDVWYLPKVGHTAAIREVADEYERRVTAFLDAALLG